jgi:hypothetical protein
MTDLYPLINHPGGLPGLMEGGFYQQPQSGTGIMADGSGYQDDAYYFMDQDLSMFGFC